MQISVRSIRKALGKVPHIGGEIDNLLSHFIPEDDQDLRFDQVVRPNQLTPSVSRAAIKAFKNVILTPQETADFWLGLARDLAPGQLGAYVIPKAFFLNLDEARYQDLETLENGSRFGQLSKAQCLMEALAWDDLLLAAWLDLAVELKELPQHASRSNTHPSDINHPKINQSDTFLFASYFPSLIQVYSKIVELDSKSLVGWQGLLDCLDVADQYQDLSDDFSIKNCLAKIIELNPVSPQVWLRLGEILDAESLLVSQPSEICLFNKTFNAKHCLANYIYYSVMQTGSSRLSLFGKPTDRKEALLTALRLYPTSPKIWFAVADVIQSGESIEVLDEQYQRSDCLVAVLEQSDLSTQGLRIQARAWLCLADCLSRHDLVEVSGQSYSRAQCYSQSLAIDAKCALVWRRLYCTLGQDESVQLGDFSYTRPECESWADYYEAMGAKLLSQEQVKTLLVRAINKNSSNAEAWFQLGVCLDALDHVKTQVLDEEPMTAWQCYLESVRLDDSQLHAWIALSRLQAQSGEYIEIKGDLIDAVDTCLHALQCQGGLEQAEVWKALAEVKPDNESVFVDGEEYTTLDCLNKAVACAPEDVNLKFNLYERMLQLEELSLMPALNDVRAHLAQDAGCTKAWKLAADLLQLKPGGYTTIAGRLMSKSQCARKAKV